MTQVAHSEIAKITKARFILHVNETAICSTHTEKSTSLLRIYYSITVHIDRYCFVTTPRTDLHFSFAFVYRLGLELP